MARIAGINIPPQQHAEIGLTAIYGIGRSRSRLILEQCGIPCTKKVQDLTDAELERIRDAVSKFTVEGDLRREVQMNIKNKMEINSYQGTRHKKGLPVHGQRTSRNARTRKGKGKTVANKKKISK